MASEVVARLYLPIPVDRISDLTDGLEAVYGRDLWMSTSIADSDGRLYVDITREKRASS